MSVKRYRIYCEPCGYSRITDGSDCEDLVGMRVSPVPGGYPMVNPQTKQVEDRKPYRRGKWFKCPQCGRAVHPRKLDQVSPVEPPKEAPLFEEPQPITIERPNETPGSL
jgi:hypothetical protein